MGLEALGHNVRYTSEKHHAGYIFLKPSKWQWVPPENTLTYPSLQGTEAWGGAGAGQLENLNPERLGGPKCNSKEIFSYVTEVTCCTNIDRALSSFSDCMALGESVQLNPL